MGLDMYLVSIDRKLDQSNIERFYEYVSLDPDIIRLDKIIKEYEDYSDPEAYAKEKFSVEILKFSNYLNNRNSRAVSTSSTEGEFSTRNTNTVDDLIYELAKELTTVYIRAKHIKGKISNAESKYFDHFKGATEKEIHYWRKHADLNHYFTQLAIERLVASSQEDFNGPALVLTREDIIDLYLHILDRQSGKYVFPTGEGFFWGVTTDEDWESTKEIFGEILNSFDFDNNTLAYICSW